MSATPTAALGFQNFFQATLTADITASSTDISMDNIPNSSEGFLVIEPDSSSKREVIFYNSKTSLKVVCPSAADGRGQDDTTATSHSTGATVIMSPVAAFYEALQSGAALTPGGITPEKLLSGTGTSWGWQDWTPTFTNFTKGNATVVARYRQIGKTVFCYVFVTLGSTSSMGTFNGISLPVTARAATYTDLSHHLGIGNLGDAGTGNHIAAVRLEDNSTARIVRFSVSGANITNAGISSTSPFTWTTGDSFSANWVYEAA